MRRHLLLGPLALRPQRPVCKIQALNAVTFSIKGGGGSIPPQRLPRDPLRARAGWELVWTRFLSRPRMPSHCYSCACRWRLNFLQ